MSSSHKFQRLHDSDDYGLDDLSQQSLQFPKDANTPPIKPTRWLSTKSIEAAYTPQVTYVTTRGDPARDHEDIHQPHSSRRQSSRLSFLANPVSNFRIPSFAAPWQHEKPNQPENSKSSTIRYFDRSKQWRRILVNSFLQWLLTVGIVICQFGALYGFNRGATMTSGEKYMFNTIITLLSLALGLAIVTALRAYAKLLSWRFLASKYRDLQDFELVMNCDSQSKVLKLLWSSRRPGTWWPNKTQILCLLSLFIVIGLQITIGMLGLTYSIDNTNAVDLAFGNVSIVDLSNVYQDASYNNTGFADQSGAANYFGLVGQSYFSYIAPLGKGNDSFETVYTADNFTYYYVDSSVTSAPETQLSYTTTRYVVANASCVKLQIRSGGYVETDTEDSVLSYIDESGSNRSITVEGQATFTTTYMSNSSASECGSRCTNVLILDTAGYVNETDPKFIKYKPQLLSCNSTVSEVFNANSCHFKDNCTLVDSLAKILAGSIGWSGTWYRDGNPLQYKTYPPGSPYCWDGSVNGSYQDPNWRSSQLSWFTAGALAAMDNSGPRITVVGNYPVSAVALDVNWSFAVPVLCVVPFVQLVILVVVCIWANGALIKDGSYLAAARLLRPAVEKLEEHGCALTGDEIARTLGNFKIIYGARAASGNSNSTAYKPGSDSQVDWHVGIISESEGFGRQAEEGWRPAATFPAGKYDGVGHPAEVQKSRKRQRVRLIIEEESDTEVEDGADEKTSLLEEQFIV